MTKTYSVKRILAMSVRMFRPTASLNWYEFNILRKNQTWINFLPPPCVGHTVEISQARWRYQASCGLCVILIISPHISWELTLRNVTHYADLPPSPSRGRRAGPVSWRAWWDFPGYWKGYRTLEVRSWEISPLSETVIALIMHKTGCQSSLARTSFIILSSRCCSLKGTPSAIWWTNSFSGLIVIIGLI